MSGEESPAKHVVNIYREEVRKLQASWPTRQLSLRELKGTPFIELTDGTLHEFNQEEVDRLLSQVPEYFWDFMAIPLLLHYMRTESGIAKYTVVGNRWQMRLAEIMLRGDYSANGVSELGIEEFLEIIRKYRSLVFVSLHL
ncbi:MAG: DUF61 family protein [Acidilobus sp.]|uniref:DUF61 family protein n=1 Tax=Acidilobus sp. 7A TaxID=1577685 RepID=UPI000764E75A|nr:DUF61 family protein [Acidilobus sp. 7A]AMD31139.1 hypothetical protein SE86_07740 [Acidilobus sp. 7A]